MDNSNSSAKPPDSTVESLLALCRSGCLDEAERRARQLIGDFPEHFPLSDILVGILASQGRFNDAIPVYEQAIAASPQNADAHFALGNLLLHVGQPAAAIDRYQRAVEIRPDFVEALSNLGAAYLGLERNAEAADVLKRAIDLNPSFADAHGNLGIALRNLGRGEESVSSFRKALELDPEAAETHNNLGAAMEDLDRLDDAIASYSKAVAIQPGYAEAHCNLANALAKSGDHMSAVESYQRAVELRPDFAEAHNSMGVSLKEMGWFENAEACFRKAISIRPGFAQAEDNLATALRRQGKLEEAAAAARAAIAHDLAFAEAYYNLGLVLNLQGELEAAVESYQKALKINPDYAEAHENLGQALQELKRFDEAIEHYEASGTRMSKARALECFFALGRKDDFDRSLEALCESDPTNIWAAGISAFAAQQWKKENPYPFCKDPLDFIFVRNVKSEFGSYEDFAARLLEEIENAETVWEPPQNTTHKGYHTLGNLFQMDTPRVTELRRVISQAIEAYKAAFADQPAGMMTEWPEECSLFGWHIRLLKDGYQESHIHPSGWLSGVIYLGLPERLDGEEGAITFTLHGRDYPIKDKDVPSFRHSPKVGDLVLFPSSLYHYTSPFHTEGERLVVAFDLCPGTGLPA